MANQKILDNLGIEIFSNSNLNYNSKEKENKNLNRFQHDQVMCENQVRQAALLPLPRPAAASERERETSCLGFREIMAAGEKKGYIRLNTNDRYTEINVQINKMRLESRYRRTNVYISLKRDTDKSYSIFLAGSATDCKTELNRGAKKHRETTLDVIATLFNEHPDAMIARLHYKAPKNVKTEKFHRLLLNHAMIAIYQQDKEWHSHLYLLGNYDYYIPLNEELSDKQKKFYDYSGIYRDIMEEFDGNDEMILGDE